LAENKNLLGGNSINIIAEEFQPTVGTLVTTLPRMFPIYSVELEIMVTGEQRDSFTNIIHLSKTGQNMVEPGDRMPAIYLRPGENKLHIGAYVNGNNNHAYNSNEILKQNIWTKVQVLQTHVDGKYIYSIYIGNRQEYVIENTTPIDIYDIKVFASDPWTGTPKTKIRNLKYSTCKMIFLRPSELAFTGEDI